MDPLLLANVEHILVWPEEACEEDGGIEFGTPCLARATHLVFSADGTVSTVPEDVVRAVEHVHIVDEAPPEVESMTLWAPPPPPTGRRFFTESPTRLAAPTSAGRGTRSDPWQSLWFPR